MLEAFIDTPMRHGQLTVYPIIAPQGPVLPYLLSTQILDSGVLTVREKGEGPAPVLLARNNSLHSLLILSGEPFPGKDPGRLVERSILLGGKSVFPIPASPIERGGWINGSREGEITEWLKSFPLQDGQVGSLAFLGERLLGLEALGSSNLYGPLHRRLLIRFIKEALNDSSVTDGNPAGLEAQAQEIVDFIEEADRKAAERVGIGEYWSLHGPVSGGELLHQGHLVHLSVQPVPIGSAVRPREEGDLQCS